MRSISATLINRDYARLWYGQAVSTLGDLIFDTTLVLWVATILARGKTWAPVAVSGIMFSLGVAVLVVGPLAGVFVDRWSRRRVMLRTEVIRAVLVGGMTALSLLPTRALPIWLWLAVIYVVVFTVTASGMFFNPSRLATIGEIVPGDVDRTRAAGIGQATTAALSIIGPPLAAPLLFTIGLQSALLINALSYVVSYVAIRSVRMSEAPPARSRPGDRTSLRADFVAGLRFFVRSRMLVTLLSIATIAQCGVGALTALDVFFVTENLHARATLYGLLSTAMGVGAIMGALLSGRIVAAIGARTTTAVGGIATGLFIFLFSRQTEFISGLLLVVAFAIPIAILDTAFVPLLLASTPADYLGRVMSVFNPIAQLASMVSVVASGWLASTVLVGFHATIAGVHVGRIDTIFSVCGLLIALAGLYAWLALPSPAASTDSGTDPTDFENKSTDSDTAVPTPELKPASE